jgi:YHS domain-containing protein
MGFNSCLVAMAVLASFSTGGLPAFGQSRPAPARKVCKDTAGVAAGGYDVVSYFSANKPEQGSPLISLKHDGAEYRFVSIAHRDQFAANPNAYLPQYGGHCAYALSKGRTKDGDPKAWLIHKGKLYFTVSREVLSLFQTDPISAIQKADEIWRQSY